MLIKSLDQAQARKDFFQHAAEQILGSFPEADVLLR